MPSPKSPQVILEHYRHFIGVNPMMLEDMRSSLASVILWCAEEMPEKETVLDTTLSPYERAYEIGRWKTLDDCRSILLQKADELTSPSKGEIKEN